MSISFATGASIGVFKTIKILSLISRLSDLGFVLTGFSAGSFFENRRFRIQKEVLYEPGEIKEKALLALQLPGSQFLDNTKSLGIYTLFQDINVSINLFLNTQNNEIEMSCWNVLKKDFPKVHDSYVNDNSRHAQFFIDIAEPFVINDCVIHGDYTYLDEQLPKNCLAVAGRDYYIEQVVDNILFNKFFITFERNSNQLPPINTVVRYIHKAPSDPAVYIRTRDSSFSVAQLVMPKYKSQLFLFPLEPYKIKTFDNEHGIDLQFYLRLLLNICNHYPIWELRTNFSSS